MAFAIIPLEANPNESREDWLTMNQADELVCELFNEPVDNKHYCHGWFDSMIYFDWYTVKNRYKFESNYAYDGFTTADKAILHFFKESIFLSSEKDIWTQVEAAKLYTHDFMEPIIRMFYDKGYKIVSLNLG